VGIDAYGAEKIENAAANMMHAWQVLTRSIFFSLRGKCSKRMNASCETKRIALGM
jgi:hypothetical protein